MSALTAAPISTALFALALLLAGPGLPAASAAPAAMALAPAEAAPVTVVAARAIRSRTVLGPADLRVVASARPGPLSDPASAIGMEARVTLYEGRPVHPADLGPPAVVERNQVVRMRYASGGLSIETEGRAMGRAGMGELVRVMNLGSRSIVSARVVAPGAVEVGR